jgi:hypothetical protein
MPHLKGDGERHMPHLKRVVFSIDAAQPTHIICSTNTVYGHPILSTIQSADCNNIYANAGHTNHVLIAFVQSVVETWQTCRLVRWV